MSTPAETRPTVVTATALETRAVKRSAPHVHLIEAGIGLAKVRGGDLGTTVVTCGLAGGLQAALPTGSVVVPAHVAVLDGEAVACDPQLSEALVSAARRFVNDVERGPLLTSASFVTGRARAAWAARGYVAADMETGLIKARRLAAVRVILDTPDRELSEAWLHPLAALARPWLWPQALWLWREGPRCARLAAEVLAAALADM